MESDGEAFGAEIVRSVKAYVGAAVIPLQAQIDQLSADVKALPAPDEPYAPPEIGDEISQAIALLAQSPAQQAAVQQQQPMVVNFTSPAASKAKSKTITTSRDADGNLVAKVIEN